MDNWKKVLINKTKTVVAKSSKAGKVAEATKQNVVAHDYKTSLKLSSDTYVSVIPALINSPYKATDNTVLTENYIYNVSKYNVNNAQASESVTYSIQDYFAEDYVEGGYNSTIQTF